MICGRRADHQRHRDRLAHGPAEAEHHRADHAALAVREDRAADHLPRVAPRARAPSFVVVGTGREDLAADSEVTIG